MSRGGWKDARLSTRAGARCAGASSPYGCEQSTLARLDTGRRPGKSWTRATRTTELGGAR
jgi:hypothetical protein